jgi:hypothetical protein
MLWNNKKKKMNSWQNAWLNSMINNNKGSNNLNLNDKIPNLSLVGSKVKSRTKRREKEDFTFFFWLFVEELPMIKERVIEAGNGKVKG